MAAKDKAAIQLGLRSLELSFAGPVARSATANHTVTVELVWPRIGIATRSHTRVVKLAGNSLVVSPDDWIGSILLKENVTGKFAIKISISQALTDPEVDELMRKVAKKTVSLIADAVEDGVGGSIGKVAAIPIDYLAALVGSSKWRPVAEVTALLNTIEFTETGGCVLTLPLQCPGKFTKTRKSSAGKRDVQQTIIKAGDPNGTAVLFLETL